MFSTLLAGISNNRRNPLVEETTKDFTCKVNGFLSYFDKVNCNVKSVLLSCTAQVVMVHSVTCRLYTPLYYRIGGRVRRQHYTWSTLTAGPSTKPHVTEHITV